MKAILTLTAILISGLVVSGQRTPGAKPPLITIDATTKDGKAVVLRSDGTWDYAAVQPETVESKAATPTRTVALEAALVFRSGDVRPMARTTFYVLDEELDVLLTRAGVKSEMQYPSGDANRDRLSSIGFAFTPRYSSFENHIALRAKVAEALRGHVVKEVATDFSGKAEITGLDAGKIYYLFGVGATPKGFALWSLPIAGDVKALVLDQNNMAVGI